MVSTTKRYGIIVGIDGSPESDAAVNWAAHDAAIRGLPLTVVHVESPAAATWSQAPRPRRIAGRATSRGPQPARTCVDDRP